MLMAFQMLTELYSSGFEAKRIIFSELKWLENCLTRDTVLVCFNENAQRNAEKKERCTNTKIIGSNSIEMRQFFAFTLITIQKLVYETDREICEKTPYCPFNFALQTD